MKRVLLLIAIVMLLLAGCQNSQEKYAVEDGNSEDYLKSTEDSGEGNNTAVQDKVNAPSEVQFESVQGRLKVVTDADVIVPYKDKMPIINVRSAVFSQDIVDGYWDELIGVTPMWNWPDQPTKSDIDEMIIIQSQNLEEAERRGDEARIKVINSRIDKLETLYASAPESVSVMSATSLLTKKVRWNMEYGIYDTICKETCCFSIQNESELTDKGSLKYFCVRNTYAAEEGSIAHDTTPATLSYKTYFNTNFITRFYNVDENIKIDESVKEELHTSPQEAKSKVQDFLDETNTPMEVRSITLIKIGDKEESTREYAYSITCARVLDNGLSLMANPGSGVSGLHFKGYMPPSPSVENSRTWDYERMVIRMNDDGFIEIVWLAPIEILDIKVEDTELLPYSEIQPVFERSIYETYEPHVMEGYYMECNISKIELELMRVWKPSADQSKYEELLTPVWNYYGTLSLHTQDGEFLGGTIDEHTVLSIDAIEGSTIDTSLGY